MKKFNLRVMTVALSLSVLMLSACGSKSENVESEGAETTLHTDSEEAENFAETDYATAEAEDEIPFDETEVYHYIVSMLDQNFSGITHKVVYDREDSALNIFIEAPDSARELMAAENPEVVEAWDEMVDSMKAVGDPLWEIVSLTDGADYASVYIVDELKSSNEYDQSEYLLWILNGEEEYNFMSDSTAGNGGSIWQYVPDIKDTGSATSGERNALSKAYDYLDFMAFSYSGLIEQLEFEGFSTSEATYAADNCGADWNEQAAKKAREYLDFMSFSRSGLIEQLEFEGFTRSQAEYGVNAVY